MKKLKVLIADDEVLLQELYVLILEAEISCDFVCVSTGNQAIEAIKTQGPFDVILSDYKMPEGNGGKVYLFNKAHHNTPFLLFSGGLINDYCELSDLSRSNPLNCFINKPFDQHDLIDAVKRIAVDTSPAQGDHERFIKVNLRHYLLYTNSAAEIYLKLADDKFAKIIDTNTEDVADVDLAKHYLNKGIECVYVDKIYFTKLIKDYFMYIQQQIENARKKELGIEIGGMPFKVCFEGLNAIGLADFQIQHTNVVIEEAVREILNNKETKESFKSFCSTQGFAVGHSLLIIYIAAALCRESGMNFQLCMKKICTAAFFHDFSLYETDASEDHLLLKDAPHSDSLLNHPTLSAQFLPMNQDLFEDSAKIILEHHEKPDGSGYPKALNSYSISPLACLFILSQEITFNLIRNDFDMERLRDFLTNNRELYHSGNFSKYFTAAENLFHPSSEPGT
jgi:response regulator RpfG family c-di-GMP phosphodiesterase